MKGLNGKFGGMQINNTAMDRDMLAYANGLIGPPDAQRWWNKHQDVFTHPRFTTRFIPEYAHFGRMCKNLFGRSDVVWAHTHEKWSNHFGVFIVRRGGEKLYEGRDENQVAWWLGLHAKL